MVQEGLMEKHEQDRKSIFKNKFFNKNIKKATYIKFGIELGQSSTNKKPHFGISSRYVYFKTKDSVEPE